MSVSEEQKSAFKAAIRYSSVAPDFKIKVRDYEWPVHSEVLSSKSEFFERVCNGGFKEAQEKVVELHDEDPWIIARLLVWLYQDDDSGDSCIHLRGDEKADFVAMMGYTVTCDPPIGETVALLYRLADKYTISTLTTATRDGIKFLLREGWCGSEEFILVLSCTIFESDPELGQCLLQSSWKSRSSTQKWFEDLQKCHANEVGIQEPLQKFLFNKLDHVAAKNHALVRSVNKARREIAAGTEKLSNQASVDRPKRRIRGAVETLKRACKEALDL